MMLELLQPAIGDQFKVARPEGVYRKGDVWTVTAYLRMGAIERGGIEVQCPMRPSNQLTMHQLATLVSAGILAQHRCDAGERDRQVLALAAASPMRAAKVQDDHSGLALFQHFDEPRLI